MTGLSPISIESLAPIPNVQAQTINPSQSHSLTTMSSSWSEIRRLQAALDEVQSSTTSHKLSERNCIEVVSKLVEMGLINVLYTMDGKEYVVTSYLETEIKRELEAHGGRVNTVELQTILNIDLTHIQKSVEIIINNEPSIELIQGELISSDYKRTLSIEINELLLQHGNVSLADLSTTIGLPLGYVIPCIESSLGTLIKGHLDKSGSGLLYTESYVSRHRARIRGTFAAMTRPSPVGPIIQRGNYNENLFHTILHDLVSSGQLSGTVHGGRADTSMYIPSVYSEMQNQWMDEFLQSNGYLEYDAIARLGVSDPVTYIQKRYKSHDLVMLTTCCLATRIIDEVEGCVLDEVRQNEKWVDILPILPSPCTVSDAYRLLSDKYGKDPSLTVINSIVTRTKFIKHCQEMFKPLITEKAAKANIGSGSFLRQVSKGNEGVASSEGGKRGGKQKKGKSGRRAKEHGDDNEGGGAQWAVKFMSNNEISHVLMDKMEDLPEEFATELSEMLSRPLQQLFQEEAKRILEEQAEGEAGVLRKRHGVLSQQVQELWSRARLMEKGLQKIEGDTRLQLVKYLLKTICTDMTNMVISYVAIDNGMKVPEDTPTLNKERVRIIKALPDSVKPLATDVNASLTSSNKDLEDFFVNFDKLCSSDSCGLMLRKLDKKKEKQLLLSHRQSLLDSLSEERDPAMILHLTVVILYQQINGYPLHTPGKLLPSIIPLLRQGMAPGDYKLLSELQDLIMLQLKASQSASMSTSTKSLGTESSEGTVEDTSPTTIVEDTPITDIKDTPITNVEEDTPITNAEGDTPITNVEGDTPITNAEGDTPITNVEGDTPITNVEDTPIPGVEEDMPITGVEEDTPITNAEGDTPIANVEGDTPTTDTEAMPTDESSKQPNKATPSPEGATPSPEGEWEMVKTSEASNEAIRSGGTTIESLKLLEEVLDERKESSTDNDRDIPSIGDGPVEGVVSTSGVVEGGVTAKETNTEVEADLLCQIERVTVSVKKLVLNK